MKRDHFVSIIIPAKNEEKVIGQCLGAIKNLNNELSDYEVIIVDDNSSDKTVEIAGQFNIKVIRKNSERRNISGLRNWGAAHAKGDILAFLDADCLVTRDWLSNAIKHYAQDSTCLIGNKYEIPEDSSLLAKAWDFILENRGKKGEEVWVPAGNMFVSKKCFESVGGFDESLVTNEDVDFCHRLKQKGCHIITDPEIQVIHLGTPQNYHALYKKELWHGTGALQTFVNDLRKVRNMRPVLYAAFYSFCITAIILCFIMSILAQSQFALIVLLIFTGMLLIIPLGLALNVLHGQRRYNLLFGVWMVYLTYGVGRANCLFRYLGKKRK